MKRRLLYLLAALAGVSLAVALNGGTGRPARTGTRAEDARRDRPAARTADLPPGRSPAAVATSAAATRTAVRRELPEDQDAPSGNPCSREMARRLQQPFPRFVARAGPAWTRVRQVLREQGIDEHVEQVDTLVRDMLAARREPDPDTRALADRERELLAELRPLAEGIPDLAQALDHVEELMEGFQAEGGAPSE